MRRVAPLFIAFALAAQPAFGQAFTGPATITAPTTTNDCVKIGPGNTNNVVDAGAPCGTSSATGANPTATIGATAVNGSASTFMRSDAAPPLPAMLPALDGSLLTNLNGSAIASGTVADARLSANVPLLNAANAFTAQQMAQGLTGTSPGWYAQVTGDTVPRVRVGLDSADTGSIAFGSGSATRDLFLERAGAATARWGAPDAALPVPQVQGVQNVVTGTSNAAGALLKYLDSDGTGTGASGGYEWDVAPAGTTGSTPNARIAGLTLSSAGPASTLPASFGNVNVTSSTCPVTGIDRPASNQIGVCVNSLQVALFTSTGLNNTVIGATTPVGAAFTSVTINPARLIMAGGRTAVNVNATTGGMFQQTAGTLNDTGDSGTVVAGYLNAWLAQTVTATSATTFTLLAGNYFVAPVCSTNVTCTNVAALGADSLSVGTSTPLTISSTGALSVNAAVSLNNTVQNGANGSSWTLRNVTSTATVPPVVNNRADTTSGLGGVSGSADLIAGGVNVVHTTSTSVTFPLGSSFNITSLTQSATAQSGTMCYNTSGAVSYDASLGCLSSLPELKDFHGQITGALAELRQITPMWASWKPGTPEWLGGDRAVQPVFNAREVSAIDNRLTGNGLDGNLRGVRYMEMTAFLGAGLKELDASTTARFAGMQAEIDQLKSDLSVARYSSPIPLSNSTSSLIPVSASTVH